MASEGCWWGGPDLMAMLAALPEGGGPRLHSKCGGSECDRSSARRWVAAVRREDTAGEECGGAEVELWDNTYTFGHLWNFQLSWDSVDAGLRSRRHASAAAGQHP